jgi:hypothetical protein
MLTKLQILVYSFILTNVHCQIFVGGYSDGSGTAIFNECPVFQPFAGGIADGSGTVIFNECPVFQPFTGGIADGSGTVIFNECPVFQPFTGGIVDGSASLLSICLIPLGIDFIDFSVICAEKDDPIFEVLLSWSVEDNKSETFKIERSIDNVNWSVLEIIESTDSYNELQHFSYIDINPPKELSYYRIESVNYTTGLSSYSEVMANKPCVEYSDLEVYPNPTNGMLYINVRSSEETNYQFLLYNDLGQFIGDIPVVWDTKEVSCKLDLSGYVTGVYFLQIRDSYTDKTSIHKVVKTADQ